MNMNALAAGRNSSFAAACLIAMLVQSARSAELRTPEECFQPLPDLLPVLPVTHALQAPLPEPFKVEAGCLTYQWLNTLLYNARGPCGLSNWAFSEMSLGDCGHLGAFI